MNKCLKANKCRKAVVLLLCFFTTVAVFARNNERTTLRKTQPSGLTEEVTAQQAQKKTIKGKVFDEKGETIVGANVWLKESTVGVATDINGEYTLTYEGNYQILVISFIGYKTQEIVIGNQSTIDVTMVPDSEKLEEAVVVAYGTQKKESVIGAISSVEVDKLKVPGSSVSNTLAGQLAGVVSVQRSGEPGKGSNFYIRGISTFNSDSQRPLVLVDGIERDLDLVDPEDIATFSILKDATATAVYGVRGANGVILVTTRKGSDGKPRINVRAEAGLTGPNKMPKMVDAVQWAQLYNEAIGRKYYSDETIQKYRDGSDPDLYPNVNWIDALYKNFASNQRVNANVSGGGSIARYYVAGSYYNEGSIFKEDKSNDYTSSINYNKINFRANLDINLTQSTILNVNLANVYEKKFSPGASLDDIWGYAFMTSPNAFPVRYSDGTFSAPGGSSGYNPYNLLTQSGYTEEYWNSAQSLVGLTQDFSEIVTPGLKANIKLSWDAYHNNKEVRSKEVNQYFATGRNEDGTLNYQEIYKGSESLTYTNTVGGYKTTYLEASLTYDRVFGKHRVGALFLYNQKKKTYTASGNMLSSLPYKNMGIAGRLTYSFDDRYFIEGNVGYNGSENFSPGKRFGVFPAFALGWMVSNEKFFQPVTHIIDMLKLKGSYGIVGNDQIGGGRRFIYEATIQYKDANGNNLPGYNWGSTGNMGGNGIRMGEVANPNVGWEEAKKLNVGFEISFFNAVKIQGDYFKEERSGIFMQRSALPGIVGLSTMPWVNVGKMNNQGFDGTIEYEQQIGEVQLTARGNFTYARSEIIDNDEPDWKHKYQNRIGKPYGQSFGLKALGLFQSQEEIDNSPTQTYGTVRVGDIKYQDIDGDGKIDANDEVAIGYPSLPEINYGFGATAAWKGFDLNVFFQGVSHTSFFIGGDAMYGFSSGNLGRAAINEDVYKHRWTAENPNPNARYPRMSADNSPNNNRNSTWRMRDGSFLRLKNMEIGYSMPKRILDKTFITSLRFYVSGQNLLTFSKFKLWDPELYSSNGAKYPISRVFTVGVNINL